MMLPDINIDVGEIFSPIVGVIGTIIGVFLGWWLSVVTASNIRKMRHFESFCEAIITEINNASNLPDNIDRRMGEFHFDSVRRLEGLAGYVELSCNKEWEKIKQSWIEYRDLVDVTATGGVISSQKEGFITRGVVLKKLRELLDATK